MPTARGTVLLDGVTAPTQVLGATSIRIDGVDGNPITSTGRSVDAYARGIWARTGPLAADDHIVVISGSAKGFRLHVEYQLTIQ